MSFGLINEKCPRCWYSVPCKCKAQEERDKRRAAWTQPSFAGGTSPVKVGSAVTAVMTTGAVVADVVGRCLWGVTGLMAVFSLLNFIMVRSTFKEMSAIQQGGSAAESLLWALIPYAIARAWDELFRPGHTFPKVLKT